MTFNIKRHIYSLQYMSFTNIIFYLSNNNLTEEIPTSIGCLSSMWLLNLSGNQLEGVIHASLGTISKLEVLDSSKNNLKCHILQELSILHEKSVLDVLSNHLCGRKPNFGCWVPLDHNLFMECTDSLHNKCMTFNGL